MGPHFSRLDSTSDVDVEVSNFDSDIAISHAAILGSLATIVPGREKKTQLL